MGQPLGYEWLVRQLGLRVLPHHRRTFLATGAGVGAPPGAPPGVSIHFLPRSYARPDEPAAHLEFAVRHEGLNLEILWAAFRVLGPEPVERLVRSKPTGRHARRLWALQELLTGEELDLPAVAAGNYVDLLDPAESYTARPRLRARQRVRDNLLGDAAFCPGVRRTPELRVWEQSRLTERADHLLGRYGTDTLERAISYLYTKETRSSFELEREAPSEDRVERFVRLLQAAPSLERLGKRELVELQALVVEPRFAEGDYRRTQNYVGETLGLHRERVHFVAPRPEDVPGLMDGLIACLGRLTSGTEPVHPVVAAAAVAFGFVFVHPFEDGNGRIHRFLIHHVLSRRGFTPAGLVFPVSAAMLADRGGYDRCLERFSAPLLPLLDYDLDAEGRLRLSTTETAHHYRYFDATFMAEQLFAWIERTIDRDLEDELAFVSGYHRAREGVRAVVDLPDRLLDLFVKLCWQGGGRISKRKQGQFSMLSEEEIGEMCEVVARELPARKADRPD